MYESFKDLLVYRRALELAMEIFNISKKFPAEEKYSSTDQIRRSSRYICTNIAESYRKRQYKAHFLSKVSDADMENSETQVWLDFSHECNYISKETHDNLIVRSEEVGRLLNHMMANPEKYRSKS